MPIVHSNNLNLQIRWHLGSAIKLQLISKSFNFSKNLGNFRKFEEKLKNFFPSNAFLRRRRKKALLRVNDRGGGWRTCILALCRVSVCVCVRVCARMS